MPPVYTSLSARCCRNALSTVVSGRSAGNRRMFARTISADAGPLATSNEMSNWNPLGRSSNLTIGTRALAMSWILVAMPLRERHVARALRHVAGDLHPLSRITASMSLLGRYMPVANEPCTSNLASGQMPITTARTRSTAAARAAASAAVGSKNRQKSTISACSRTSGDSSRRNRSDVPGGHHGGSEPGRSSSAAHAPQSSSSDAHASAAATSMEGASETSAPGGSSGSSSKSTPKPTSGSVASPPTRRRRLNTSA